MAFPASAHMKFLPRNNNLTEGQMMYLYNYYVEGVNLGKIKYYQDGAPLETVKYLQKKTNLPYTDILGFLLSLKDYAIEKNTEYWRIPKLTAQEKQKTVDSVTAPLNFITKSIGTGARNISEPITKPLLFISIIAVSGVLIYGGVKAGVFKDLSKKIVRKR